jgi:hypothetical protein
MSAKTNKKPPAAKDETSAGDGNGAGAKASGDGEPKAAAKPTKRLRPGELDGLVLSYMCKNAKDLPVSPGTVAKAIGRSSGAVGNCLDRLAKAKKARLAKKAPRAYDLKGVKAR